jgi:hypothetical protein
MNVGAQNFERETPILQRPISKLGTSGAPLVKLTDQIYETRQTLQSDT